MAEPGRLAGIDFLRGVAAFGVVVIHVGLVVGGNVTPEVARLQQFFTTFAVPFFLAAAFYFAVAGWQKPKATESFSRWMGKTARRLVVPYLLWTAIYTTAQLGETLLVHRGKGIGEVLWNDPVNRYLFGGSGVALYFLPLLLVGLILARILSPLLLRISFLMLVANLMLSISIAEVVTATGNGFRLDQGTAFEPLAQAIFGASAMQGAPWRIALVILAHLIRCLPYPFLAVLILRYRPSLTSVRRHAAVLAFLSIVFVVGSTETVHLPEALVGFSLVFIGLEISRWIKQGHVQAAMVSLGACAFGIYLVHQLILEVLKLALRAQVSGSLFSMLALSAFTFLSAWLLVAMVSRLPWPTARRLFGLHDQRPTPPGLL